MYMMNEKALWKRKCLATLYNNEINETLHTLNSAWGISTCGMMIFDTITITILLKYMNIVIIPQGGKSLTEDI